MEFNFIQVIFWWLAIITFVPGLFTNYGDKYIPNIFLQLFRYGRANVAKKGSKTFGFVKKIEVPKNWFYHSYIFSVLFQSLIIYTVLKAYANKENDNWISAILKVIGGNERPQTIDATTTVLAVSLYLIQVCRRLYETCFVCVFSNTKMNIVHYLLAWLHYPGSMFSILTQSPGFSSDNASPSDFEWSFENITIWHILGTIVFLYGSWAQYQAHIGLASLRKGKDNKIVTMKHQIPKGGLFELISCPNYWGEIVAYCGFSVLFGFKNYTWNYIALWVASNQVIVGIMNHKWYLETFPDYPKNRKAVIPYIW